MANRITTVFLILIACTATVWGKPRPTTNGGMQIPLLRLKLVMDQFNNDDIAIGFLSTATTQYNNQLDSRYLPGIDAPEGLASFSSDNVPLSVNIVPLPAAAPLVIRLDVEAQKSGPFTLARTQLDSIPPVYDVWLMDKYAKDSLNLRTDTSYAFNVNKSDTASFGSNRFTVVIRQKAALMMHLLGFSAKKGSTGNELTWTTENEQSTTTFSVERSIDDGKTFFMLDSLLSDGTGSYTYDDKSPMSGDNLYRLKIHDVNGVIIYSNVAAVDDQSTAATVESNALNVYPNPSNGIINVAINSGNSMAPAASGLQTSALQQSFAAANPRSASSYAIKIVNMKGVLVRSAISSSPSWQDNVSSLTPGTYIVQVISNGNKLVGKSTFIKL